MSSLLNEPIIIYVSENGTTGPKGDTGNGIESISILSEAGLVKTYRILYTDGNYFDFEVTDGNGIAAIAKTGTAGLVDTYTITFTNGATTTFTVTNGEKGDKGDKGDTGNGISSIVKTDTVGLVDTYQIAFTDGTVTTFNVTNGNGILSVKKTGTAGLADTYTITFTNGTTSTYVVTNGKGITVIEKTATVGLTDAYTITYNDGTTSTFTVSNGNGIASVAKTGTAGLVDTYTITFTDGTSTTFEVTNGSDTWGQITGTLSDQTDLQNALDDKANAITETASGAMVTIEDGAEAPVKSLTVGIEPVQDLHGYDSPWPAGGGVNKLACPTAQSDTNNGITVSTNGTGIYKITGTATGGGTFVFDVTPFTTPSSGYLHLMNNVANSNITFSLRDSSGTIYGSSFGFIGVNRILALSEQQVGVTVSKLYIYVNSALSGQTLDITFSPMICDNSTATAFAPYSNICPITGHTQAVVTRTGKNLYTMQITEQGVRSWTIDNDGYIRYNGITDGRTFTYANCQTFLKLSAGTYYIYGESTDAPVSGSGIRIIDSDNNAIKTVLLNGLSTISSNFTLSEDRMVGVHIKIVNEDASTPHNYRFVISTEPVTAYEPYQGQTISVTFPSEAGTVYGGTVDVTNRTLTVDRAMVSNFTWGRGDISGGKYRYISILPTVGLPSDKNINLNKSYCNCLSILNNGQTYTGDQNGYTINTADNVTRLYVFIEGITTVEQMNDFTNQNSMQLVYPLATPLTYTLTQQELTTLLGYNAIWADTGDVTVEYRADTKLYIDNAIAKSQTATRSLITGIEASMTATQNYTTGALIIVGDDLYKATANIANGGTLTVGTNVSKITLAQYILEQLSA